MNQNPVNLRKSAAVAMGLLLAAAVASLFPEALLLDRDALLRGELWRLWTGHLVHRSVGHFVLDVGAGMLLLGFLPARRQAVLAVAPIVGVGVLLADPELATYAGLSGVLHAWTVMVAVDLCRGSKSLERILAGSLLVGVFAKALIETFTATAIFTTSVDMGGETIYVAHLLGAAAGAIFSLMADRGSPGRTTGHATAATSSPGLGGLVEDRG